MKHHRFALEPPSFGTAFANLRNLAGTEVFVDWFASRNRIRPQTTDVHIPQTRRTRVRTTQPKRRRP